MIPTLRPIYKYKYIYCSQINKCFNINFYLRTEYVQWWPWKNYQLENGTEFDSVLQNHYYLLNKLTIEY